MNKAVILLVALTLYCCIPELHASKLGCRCIKTTSLRVAVRTVAKVEVTPPSGRCRRAERVVIRKNGSKVCISSDASWFPELLSKLNQDYENVTSSTVSPATF
ncbi:C-X-C motif chemokine 2 [Poeciliopsis prolifica]|uniref:C-X-C motif chemokine 2 n=1 Tax=Poeciliopsis prolifica TaxID=188132 RepID=UPI0024131A96|nr:C-X-C motif chemokine 2 [Poeciliopsis prolifica]XP_054895699.1 C-X-C motif chemokine 2 [Poeciliopsis prolifica]